MEIRCSICKTNLQHNSKTYGGITAGGMAALAGECCKSKLKEVIVPGVYTRHNYDRLTITSDAPEPATLPADQLDSAVEHLQDYFTKIDGIAADIAKRGGLPLQETGVNRRHFSP